MKLTGAGFPVYKGKGARLQRALINYFLDINTKAGYLEVEPPVMVNEASGFGTGQLPDKEGQMYHATLDNYYLVPTAEVPVTNIYRDVILGNNDFPVKMTAYTPCFRREAGSYGKDVRGLNRLHQFDKVEIVRIEKPEDSYAALDEMIAHVEGIVKSLGLPYRILRLCGGEDGLRFLQCQILSLIRLTDSSSGIRTLTERPSLPTLSTAARSLFPVWLRPCSRITRRTAG